MNLIEKLKGIFHEKELTLEHALKRLKNDAGKHEKETLDSAYRLSGKAHSEFQALCALLEDFEKTDVQEKRARASKSVKDRFCAYAKNQISALGMPEKDMEDIRKFVSEASGVINSLGGLTPKQMMHIKFFFAEDIRPVSAKIGEISALLDEAKKLATRKKPYSEIKKMLARTEELDNAIKNNTDSIGNSKSRAAKLKTDSGSLSNEIDKIDTKGFAIAEGLLTESESRKSLVQQEIDSYLAFDRALKILKHERNVKNPLLDAYISSPSSALLEDETLRIVNFMKSVIELHEKGLLDLGRKAEKARHVVASAEYIGKLRWKLIHADKEIRERQGYFEREIKPMMARKESLEKERASAEGEIRKAEELAAAMEKEILEAEEEKERLGKELKALLSAELGAKVV